MIAEARAFVDVALLGTMPNVVPYTAPEPTEETHDLVPTDMVTTLGNLGKQMSKDGSGRGNHHKGVGDGRKADGQDTGR